MKTSEFIAALAADPVPEPIRLGRRVALALAIGFLGSLAIYGLLMGPRPDIAAAAETMRFWLKFVDLFAFALPTLLLTLRLARPDAKPGTLALWLIAPFVLLAAGVVAELLVVPQGEWLTRLIGHNSMFCMRIIPLLAAPMLAALIVALRAGAPLHPALRVRSPALPQRGSRPSSTPRTAPMICRCSWRRGICSRRSSAWASARWPAGAF